MATTQIKDGYNGGSDNQLRVNDDGSINVVGSGGGGTSNVNIHDSSGNNLTSTAGALNVNTTGSSTVTGTVTSNEAGLDSFQTSQITVGTSVVSIPASPLANRSSISIKVHATSSSDGVYISNTNTPGSGYLLNDGESIQLDLTPTSNIFAQGTSPGQIVYTLEMA